ncbi:MAG TPA: alpha/beta hydrolase domain-containing protein [Terriglobia bacterium]|nr:alpha/beta hydrolase domain-containing protein [Terriglobia bacterium]
MSMFRRVTFACVLVAAGAICAAVPARASIKKVQITAKESPTFGGYSWPGVGQYEKIIGKAFGELDPKDPKNAVIVDLQLAPRNARGKVEYSFDFYILRPMDLGKGNHKMLYEPPNRGRKTINALNRGVGGNDPGAVTDASLLANSFLMPQGYSISFSGWDFSAETNGSDLSTTITLPIARNPDGSSITGPSFEYIVNAGASYGLTYPAATLDRSKATLTHRVHLNDAPQVIPDSSWQYNANGTAITLLPAGKSFVQNDIYEFSYTAKDPTVNGIGFAAVRDWNAWLRYETKDDAGTANPLAGDVTRIYTEVSSQPGRFLNDFRYLGFNQAENGKQVFDGMMQWISAGDGISMNYRWSQPGRTERNRQDHLFVEARFPFANVETKDPITGKTDSRYAKCAATRTCPFAMEIFSANEYWVKAASLMTTDPAGKKDLPDSPFTRIYFMSSMQHGTGNAASRGSCQQFQNPLDSQAVQRALFIALDKWATAGTMPPPSQVPKLSDGTLVKPDQSSTGFPGIPGVAYSGFKTTRYLLNYGPNFYKTGIPPINPPVFAPPYQDNSANGPIYPSFVPKTDADGNDIAGLRLPEVQVPLATYTGWALRAAPHNNDGCEGSGQYIPFPKTKADRLESGDPRLSIEERYGNFETYASKLQNAINGLVQAGYLLPVDAEAALKKNLDNVVKNNLLPKK